MQVFWDTIKRPNLRTMGIQVEEMKTKDINNNKKDKGFLLVEMFILSLQQNER
jgi:hypothetical protein